MARRIRARVRAGKLELLETVDLPEGREVTLIVEETPERTAADEAFARAPAAWKGTVDVEALIQMLCEARLRPGRGGRGQGGGESHRD